MEIINMQKQLKVCLFLFTLSLITFKVHAQDDWLRGYREATVAIGKIDTAIIVDDFNNPIVLQNGDTLKKAYFNVVGTGVLFGHPDTSNHNVYLVTAKHVVYDPAKNWFPEKLRIRFSWFADKSVFEHFGSEVILRNRNNEIYWRPHPIDNFDLAVCQLNISIKEAGRSTVSPVRLENLATENESFEGANILLFGYPGAVGISYWSKPLVRQGIISYVDVQDFGKKPILIDAMVFPGNSGGPVFTIPTGMTRTGSMQVGGRSTFLGIVSKAARQGMEVEKIKVNPDSTKYKSFDFMGIGIIEPANRVKELLESL
jgi:hypothetical protein